MTRRDLSIAGSRTPSDPIVIVAIGDSITFGQYVNPTQRWTTLVERRFAAQRAAAVEVINRGVSGETTRQGLERFPGDLQQAEPDIVTLQYGLNDCNAWETDRGLPRVSERAFSANLVEMIGRARHFGTDRIILSTNHRTLRKAALPSGEPYEDANARYSELVRAVAAETGVLLCDIREAFEPFSDAVLQELLLPPPDHLHLSVAGNQVYADAIWPLLERCVLELLAERRRRAAKTA